MAVSHQGSPALPEGKSAASKRATAAEGSGPASAQPQDQAADRQAKPAEEANVPIRRNSGRTRKIPSRLLSPSPPPSKPSNYYNPSKIARAASASGKAASSSTPTTERSAAPPSSTKAAGRKSMPASSSAEDMTAATPLGPGKRKRRPSSMSGVPTAITSSADAAAGSSTSPTKASASSSTGFKAKARLSSKSNSPGPRDAEASSNASAPVPSSSKSRKASGSIKRQPSLQKLPQAPPAAAGYESDGGAPASSNAAGMDNDDEDEIDLLGPASAKKRKGSTSQALNAATASSLLTQVFEPPPLLGRTGTVLTALGESPRQLVVPTPLKASRPRTSLAAFESSARGRGLHGSDPASHFARYSAARLLLQASQSSTVAGEESEADDEDDFHKAMLDGGDFDTLDDEEPVRGGRSWGSKGACSSDAESTPATTPRSPQSNCDARDRRLGHETPNPYPRGSTDSLASTADTDPVKTTTTPSKGKERARDGAAVSFNEKATVFAHALPPASRKPGTSAGSLTLSLPYDEEAADTIRSSAPTSADAAAETTNVGIGLTVPGADGSGANADSALLSPGQALLGLHGVSKLAPGTSSPFALASVGGPSSPAPLQLGASMWSQDSSDGRDSSGAQAQITVPPSSSRLAALVAEAAAFKTGDSSIKEEGGSSNSQGISSVGKRSALAIKHEADQDDDEWLAGSSGSISPHSSLSARMEERDEEDLYHLAGAPEAMCLSELDRAWDSSERVEAYKASCMAAAAAVATASDARRPRKQEDIDMAEAPRAEDEAKDDVSTAAKEEQAAPAVDEAVGERQAKDVEHTPPSRRSSRGGQSARRNSTQRSKGMSSIASRRSSSPAEPSGPVALRSGKRGSLGLDDGGNSSAKRTTRSGSAAAKEVDASPSIRRSKRVAS